LAAIEKGTGRLGTIAHQSGAREYPFESYTASGLGLEIDLADIFADDGDGEALERAA